MKDLLCEDQQKLGVAADGLVLLSFNERCQHKDLLPLLKGTSGRLAGDGRGTRSRALTADIKIDECCQLVMVENVFLKSFFVLLCVFQISNVSINKIK